MALKRPLCIGNTSGDQALDLQAIEDGDTIDPAVLPASAIADGDKGDVTVSGSGAAWAVNADAISNAKLANAAAQSVKANATGSSANPTDLALGADDLLGRIGSGNVQGITLADLTEETTPATGDFLLGWESGGGVRKFDVGDLPGGTVSDDSVTNAKLAEAAAYTIKGNATGSTANPSDLALADQDLEASPAAGDFVLIYRADGSLAVADIDDLPPGDTSGLQETAEKGAADGYAGLDSLGMVPTAQQRPRAWDKTVYEYCKVPSVATIAVNGHSLTPTMDGEQADNSGNSGSWLTFTSVSESTGPNPPGSPGGLYTLEGIIRDRWSPVIQDEIRTVSTANIRLWCGIASAHIHNVAPVADGAAFTLSAVAFVYDTTVHGTAFWRCHTSNGSNAKVTTTSVAFAGTTLYKLRVVITAATSVEFFINDVSVATHSTFLPGISTTMDHMFRLHQLTSSQVSCDWKRRWVSHD